MADKAYVTPAVLRWARESARLSEGDAAAKAAVSETRLKEWEEGTAQPSIRQAQLLAKAYKRPFALFFLPDIPRDFQPLQDYRKPGSRALSTSSIFIIRDIQQKQSWISETAAEHADAPVPFVGRASIGDNPQRVAQDILQTLELTPGAYPDGNALKAWINAAEANGIFVSRSSFIHSRMKLDSDELQGFAIADPHAPFVFINSEDWPAAQLFTLAHEIAHIWTAQTGISSDIIPELTDRTRMHPVELFCNEVAASALMPAALLLGYGQDTFKQYVEVYKIARTLGVSSYALLVRALKLDVISLPHYRRLKDRAEAEYASYLQREEEKKARQKEREEPGGPNPYLLRVNKNSRLFTQIVLDAFRGGEVPPTQASFLLNTPVNKFGSLEAQLYR